MAETKIICDTDVMIDYLDARQNRHVITKTVLEEKIGLERCAGTQEDQQGYNCNTVAGF